MWSRSASSRPTPATWEPSGPSIRVLQSRTKDVDLGKETALALFRRTPLVVTTVDLFEGSQVAVDVAPSPGRWPEDEGSDRLIVPLGLAAMALARAEEGELERVRPRLRFAAARAVEADPLMVGSPDWCESVSGLRLIEFGTPGRVRIVSQLVKSALGPVPTVGRASPSASALATAATATMAVCLGRAAADARLALALAVEGLLGWYQVADPHLQPPQQAIAYALRHAAARLDEAGRHCPPELARAVTQHRKIEPMAGGA